MTTPFTPAMASRIELWPLDRLKPYAKNARTHSDAQVAQIASSIVEYGFTAPLLVSGDGDIMAAPTSSQTMRLPKPQAGMRNCWRPNSPSCPPPVSTWR